MVTRIGERLVYDNFGLGAAVNELDPKSETVFMTFTDHDNHEIHMFEISKDKIEQYFNLVRQTATGSKIQVAGANQMPKGAA